MRTQQPRLPKIELGKCPFCEKEIITLEQIGNRQEPKFLNGYATFWVRLSDGTKMKVAICDECKKDLTEDKASQVVEAHREFWKKGIDEAFARKVKELEEQKKQQVNYYANISLVKLGLRERDIEE